MLGFALLALAPPLLWFSPWRNTETIDSGELEAVTGASPGSRALVRRLEREAQEHADTIMNTITGAVLFVTGGAVGAKLHQAFTTPAQ